MLWGKKKCSWMIDWWDAEMVWCVCVCRYKCAEKRGLLPKSSETRSVTPICDATYFSPIFLFRTLVPEAAWRGRRLSFAHTLRSCKSQGEKLVDVDDCKKKFRTTEVGYSGRHRPIYVMLLESSNRHDHSAVASFDQRFSEGQNLRYWFQIQTLMMQTLLNINCLRPTRRFWGA